MSEDMTAQIRVAISVVIASALVAAVLNIIAIAGSILSTGSTTLRSGVAEIQDSEWKKYDQALLSGTDVKTALSLYSNREIAIIVRNRACIKNIASGTWAYNYGALLTGATLDAGNSSGVVYRRTSALMRNAGESWYRCNKLVENGVVKSCTNYLGISTSGDTEYVLETANYRSELIIDENGEKVGILFTQISGVD